MRIERFSVVPGVSRLEGLTLQAVADLPRALGLAANPDVLIVAGDTTSESADTLSAACMAALGAGVRYVCCWGPGCERLHDTFDEAHVARELAIGREFELFTTFHANESLADALTFGVHVAWPASQVVDRQVLIVSLGDEVSAVAADALTRGAPLIDEA